MEWIPPLALLFGYFLERIIGTPLKRRFLINRTGKTTEILPPIGKTVAYFLAVLLSLTGIYLHHHFFYRYAINGFVLFSVSALLFLPFLNSKLFKECTQSLFSLSLKGKTGEESSHAMERMKQLVISLPPVEAEDEYPAFFTLATVFLLETAIAPIFLFLIGGYLLFALYVLLYSLLAFGRVTNPLLREFYCGMLFLPGILNLFLSPFTAFAAGHLFNKVVPVAFFRAYETLQGHYPLLNLNILSLVAILETSIRAKIGVEIAEGHFGDEKKGARTYIKTQRLMGIQKFLACVFCYYLYIIL